jgi:2-(1,2-epoxy-1,2-dihydrophenyl)acetyl-CoA isomerase
MGKGGAKMKRKEAFDQETDFFSAKKIDEIIVITFKEKLFLKLTEWEAKGKVFDYFDFVSKSDSIKVIIIESPYHVWHDDYFVFYSQSSGPDLDTTVFQRMFNAVNQFILSIVDSEKIVVHVAAGDVISMLFSINLACDYGLVSENAVFSFPHMDLGLVPKGGVAFFLSKILGSRKASQILLSGKDISAQEALSLGIVDEVVPANKLKERALSKAREFAQQPRRSLSGVKRLLNYSLSDLKDYLDFENEILLKIIITS